jgi:FtsP/CotA-like multicopper oxidase with cupredoxin domain
MGATTPWVTEVYFGLSCATTRRKLLLASAVGTLASSLPACSARAGVSSETRLTAAPGRVTFLAGQTQTEVWNYNGSVPGPVVRLQQGEPARIIVENRLAEDTTVHWHGVRVPNAMDGVPGLTQPAIKPGEMFTYEFTPPDAGTFWYHSHANSLEQLGRGLAGAVIVQERDPLPVDRDVLWFLSDWRLTEDAQIAPGFGNSMEAGMSGRVGNLVTLNGSAKAVEPVAAGERIRLRLVNGAIARIMALHFEGHRPIVVALDGQPCDPHEPKSDRIVLGPAMRADVVLDMRGLPGHRYAVVDDFYDGLAYRLTQLEYDERAPVRQQSDVPILLPRNPIAEPNLADADRHDLVLQGGMMGGGAMAGMGGMMGMGGGAAWAINGASMAGDGGSDVPPAFTIRRGRSVVLTLRNQTAWHHPMHLHGHSFRVLTLNGAPVPHRQWRDTVLLAPQDTAEIAFVADNPGDWMVHCHVMDHQVSGLMTVLRIEQT